MGMYLSHPNGKFEVLGADLELLLYLEVTSMEVSITNQTKKSIVNISTEVITFDEQLAIIFFLLL